MTPEAARQNWRQRWADRQNEKRGQAFDASLAAWQNDDHEARRMLAAAQTFHGLDPRQVAPYLDLHRGETAFWLLPAVALVQTAAQLALPPPSYANFLPYPSPPGQPSRGNIIDTGVAVVTNKRIVLVGAHRREWLYSKLVGLADLPDNRTTLMRVSNRVKVSGLTMEPAAARSFRFNVALGLADFAKDRPGFVAHLEQQIGGHQARRPQPPSPATPEQAPLAARFGPGAIAGVAVTAVLVLCVLIGLVGSLAPQAETDTTDHDEHDRTATTIATQPPPSVAPPTTTLAAPTSGPTATPTLPTRTVSPATRPPTRAVRPSPRPTTARPKPSTVSLCGAPSNPYGYNYCGRGPHIYNPKPDICSYFDCILAFWDGVGYMIECDDGMVSMSGGRQGSCSHHGGNNRTVYDG
jgi:hypothetical protein